jgi:hexosaminidase
MYREAGLTLNTIHTGGDEVPSGVWTKSPLCADFMAKNPAYPSPKSLQLYFIKRMNDLLFSKNMNTAGWEEISIRHVDQGGKQVLLANPDFTAKRMIPYNWNTVWGWGNEDIGYKLANAGYKVVLCNAPSLYFDLAYCKDSVEPGYTWAGFIDTRQVFAFTPTELAYSAFSDRLGNTLDQNAIKKSFTALTPEGKQNIIGIQACLWGENVKGARLVDYMLFPRLLALSERAWAKKPSWESEEDGVKRNEALYTDWNRFANMIGQLELKVLDQLGVKYRKPSKGKVIENGVGKTNSEFPGSK